MTFSQILGLFFLPLGIALGAGAQPCEEVMAGANLLSSVNVPHKILSAENGNAYLVFESSHRLYLYDGSTGTQVCSKRPADLDQIESVLKPAYGELTTIAERPAADGRKPLNGCYIISLAASKHLAATPGVSHVTILTYFLAKPHLSGGVREGHTVAVYQQDGQVFVQDPAQAAPYSVSAAPWPRKIWGASAKLAAEIVRYRAEHRLDLTTTSARTKVQKTVSESVSGDN